MPADNPDIGEIWEHRGSLLLCGSMFNVPVYCFVSLVTEFFVVIHYKAVDQEWCNTTLAKTTFTNSFALLSIGPNLPRSAIAFIEDSREEWGRNPSKLIEGVPTEPTPSRSAWDHLMGEED